MAMFTRRELQKMLDHLEAHLPFEARKKLAHELNRQSSSALGFEWETALLFGFSHIGKISYEAPSAQGSRPDIIFAEDLTFFPVAAIAFLLGVHPSLDLRSLPLMGVIPIAPMIGAEAVFAHTLI